MKALNKKTIKIVSVSLAAVMLAGGIGAVSYAAGKTTGEDRLNMTEQEMTDAAMSAGTLAASKDETVYVLAGADGTPKKIIVSDWIKNENGDDAVTDKTDLSDVEVTKGDATYTIDENNMRVWQSGGEDIYYSGTSDKELPVSVNISYKLDGKSVSPDELAGKSGKLTMRFDYSCNVKTKANVNGSATELYVPFMTLTGMILPSDTFKNVSVTNGKIINDADRTIVAGMALPGLKENLNIKSDKFEIPDYVEITADVTDFEMETTVTVATNEIFNEIDLKDADSLDDLTGSLDKLKSAMQQLMDGSDELYGGLQTLLSKTNDLTSSVAKLKNGAKNVSEANALLASKIGALNSSMQYMSSKSGELNAGAEKVFATLLAAANKELSSSGLNLPALTKDNYSAVLSGAISNLDEAKVRQQATAAAKKSVTEKVAANDPSVAEAKQLVYQQYFNGALQKVLAAQGMTLEQYNALGETEKNAINAAAASYVDSSAVDASTVEAVMASQTIKDQIEAAVTSAKEGATSLTGLKASLDEYNKFYTGLISYTAGVDEASAGVALLSTKTTALSAGAQSLYENMQKLADGTVALSSGVKKLADGSLTLSDGLKQFNDEGISKLVNAVDGDISEIAARLKATVEASKSYTTYAGKADDTEGSVKFIYETDAISKTTEEE